MIGASIPTPALSAARTNPVRLATALPLAPPRPGQRVEGYERCGVRTIVLPCRHGGIALDISRTTPLAFTQRAHALKIAERLRPNLGDLRWVEIKRGHSP